jgi:polyribonucleotide nucleotidyltransferase
VCLGRVVRILDFGAFVEIRPGVEGLCHISQIDKDRVDNIEKFLKPDDEMMVKVIDIDKQGRIKLSRKEAMGKQPE